MFNIFALGYNRSMTGRVVVSIVLLELFDASLMLLRCMLRFLRTKMIIS